MTHIINLRTILRGFIRLITPRHIISPRGIAPRSVSPNISSVFKKPKLSELNTLPNINF